MNSDMPSTMVHFGITSNSDRFGFDDLTMADGVRIIPTPAAVVLAMMVLPMIAWTYRRNGTHAGTHEFSGQTSYQRRTGGDVPMLSTCPGRIRRLLNQVRLRIWPGSVGSLSYLHWSRAAGWRLMARTPWRPATTSPPTQVNTRDNLVRGPSSSPPLGSSPARPSCN